MNHHDTALHPVPAGAKDDTLEIAGVRLATAQAGIRYKGRTDVLYAMLRDGTLYEDPTTPPASSSVALAA